MKVRLRHRGTLYRLFGVEQTGDWSIVITWDRTSESATVQQWSSNCGAIVERERDNAPMRLTYHTTGQVNYHGWVNLRPAYFEPLSQLSEPLLVIATSVPSASRLELLEKPQAPGDHVLQIIDEIGDERFTLGFVFCPLDFETPPNSMLRIDYDLFSILILRIQDPPFAASLSEHFHHCAPEGPHTMRQLSKDAAMLAYHQNRIGSQQLWVYPPNGEGVYTLFPSVEMRIVPRLNIAFVDPELRAEVVTDRARPMMIPFRIFQNGRRVTKADLRAEIMNIELDAEL